MFGINIILFLISSANSASFFSISVNSELILFTSALIFSTSSVFPAFIRDPIVELSELRFCLNSSPFIVVSLFFLSNSITSSTKINF